MADCIVHDDVGDEQMDQRTKRTAGKDIGMHRDGERNPPRLVGIPWETR